MGGELRKEERERTVTRNRDHNRRREGEYIITSQCAHKMIALIEKE